MPLSTPLPRCRLLNGSIDSPVYLRQSAQAPQQLPAALATYQVLQQEPGRPRQRLGLIPLVRNGQLWDSMAKQGRHLLGTASGLCNSTQPHLGSIDPWLRRALALNGVPDSGAMPERSWRMTASPTGQDLPHSPARSANPHAAISHTTVAGIPLLAEPRLSPG